MNTFKIGDKVKTKNNIHGQITGIYDGYYPYVVRIYINGMPYLSDYSEKDLTISIP